MQIFAPEERAHDLQVETVRAISYCQAIYLCLFLLIVNSFLSRMSSRRGSGSLLKSFRKNTWRETLMQNVNIEEPKRCEVCSVFIIWCRSNWFVDFM